MNTADFVTERDAAFARQYKGMGLNIPRIDPVTSAKAANEDAEDVSPIPDLDTTDDESETEFINETVVEKESTFDANSLYIVLGVLAVVLIGLGIRKYNNVKKPTAVDVARSENIVNKTLRFA